MVEEVEVEEVEVVEEEVEVVEEEVEVMEQGEEDLEVKEIMIDTRRINAHFLKLPIDLILVFILVKSYFRLLGYFS